jgi:hypothetical protein
MSTSLEAVMDKEINNVTQCLKSEKINSFGYEEVSSKIMNILSYIASVIFPHRLTWSIVKPLYKVTTETYTIMGQFLF